MRAVFHGLHGLVNRAVRGHHDHRHVAVGSARSAQNVKASAVRHAQIRQHDFMRNAADFVDCFARVRRLSYRVSSVFQRQTQNAAQALFVFDEKNVRHVTEPPAVAGGYSAHRRMAASSFTATRKSVKHDKLGKRAHASQILFHQGHL